MLRSDMALVKRTTTSQEVTPARRHLSEIELAPVVVAYLEGGMHRVRYGLGLDEWSDAELDDLLARALRAHPVEYEDIEAVEGLHDGLVAKATKQVLIHGTPKEVLKAVEVQHKLKGRMRSEKESAADVLNAMSALMDRVLEYSPPEDRPKGLAPAGTVVDVDEIPSS